MSVALASTVVEGVPRPGLFWALVVLHSAPIALRRREPWGSFVVSAAAGLVFVALGYPTVALGVTTLIMVYSLASQVPWRSALVALVAVELAAPIAVVIGDQGMQLDTVIGNGVAMAAAWGFGSVVRRRQESAVADRELEARNAVSRERVRIARELHDIVGHSMMEVATQAGMARVVLEDDPELARRSLLAIEGASRDAMAEMRSLLEVLRSEDADADLGPTPRLSDLEALVTQVVASGTPVEVAIVGDRRELSAGVELTGYRVVQEGLTNVRKHAPGAAASVRIEYGPDRLSIQIENAAHDGSRMSDGGLGLVGMRERLAVFGGDLTTDLADGRFRLAATIPYRTAVSP